MTNLHEIAAARPFALEAGAGERIWFTSAEMTIKATAATTDGHLCLIETRAPAGHGPPMHVHHDEHEAFYVLEGELDVACGDERYRAPAGSFAFLPRGVAHTFPVVGDAPARLLTLGLPGGVGGLLPRRWPPGRQPRAPACRTGRHRAAQAHERALQRRDHRPAALRLTP